MGFLSTLPGQRCFSSAPREQQEAALTSQISIYKAKAVLKGLSQNCPQAKSTFQTSASLSKGCFFSL